MGIFKRISNGSTTHDDSYLVIGIILLTLIIGFTLASLIETILWIIIK